MDDPANVGAQIIPVFSQSSGWYHHVHGLRKGVFKPHWASYPPPRAENRARKQIAAVSGRPGSQSSFRAHARRGRAFRKADRLASCRNMSSYCSSPEPITSTHFRTVDNKSHPACASFPVWSGCADRGFRRQMPRPAAAFLRSWKSPMPKTVPAPGTRRRS